MSRQDQSSDELTDGGDDGVPKAAHSVHPMGNSIIHSADSGWSIPRPTLSQSQSVIVKPSPEHRPLAVPLREPFASPVVRVGNNPEAIPALRGAKIGSR